jgi:hypothetical protein
MNFEIYEDETVLDLNGNENNVWGVGCDIFLCFFTMG